MSERLAVVDESLLFFGRARSCFPVVQSSCDGVVGESASISRLPELPTAAVTAHACVALWRLGCRGVGSSANNRPAGVEPT